METLDFDARYRVASMPGVAFSLLGYATDQREVDVLTCTDTDHDHDSDCGYVAFEEVENTGMVRAVMVGDDRVHLVDTDDLVQIGEDEFCSCCGQIGCGWGVNA